MCVDYMVDFVYPQCSVSVVILFVRFGKAFGFVCFGQVGHFFTLLASRLLLILVNHCVLLALLKAQVLNKLSSVPSLRS